MQTLDTWEEITGILTQVQQRDNQTLITVDDTVVSVSDLSPAELDREVDKEISVVRTDSGHQWTVVGGDQ